MQATNAGFNHFVFQIRPALPFFCQYDNTSNFSPQERCRVDHERGCSVLMCVLLYTQKQHRVLRYGQNLYYSLPAEFRTRTSAAAICLKHGMRLINSNCARLRKIGASALSRRAKRGTVYTCLMKNVTPAYAFLSVTQTLTNFFCSFAIY